MADDQIAVELTAKVDALTSGLTEAVSAMRGAVEAMRGDMHKLEETAHESESTLKKILSGEAFIVFKEKAELAMEAVKVAIESVKEGFESTVGAAEEFGLSNAKFAIMMGTSEEKAAGLAAALHGVGSSAEQYEGMALKLEMRLKSNEKGMQELGVATRDSSGHLLSGKELMDSAISTMKGYKTGTDQNSFALEVFGKKASQIYDIMRVGDEQVEHQIEIYRSFGVQMSGNMEDSERLEEAVNDLHTEFQALALHLGQTLMPVAQELIEWLGHEGKDVLSDISKDVEDVVMSFLSFARGVWSVIDALKSMASIASSVMSASSGDQSGPATAGGAKAMILDMPKDTDNASSSVDHLAAAWKGLDEAIKRATERSKPKPFRMFDPDAEEVPTSLARPKPWEGGSKSFVAPHKGNGKTDKTEDNAIQSVEKLALERIKIEETTNAHLLAMGQESEEAFLAQQRDLENRTYAIKLDSLNKELAVHGKSKADLQKLHEEIQLLEVAHQGAMLKIDQEAESKKAEAKRSELAEFIKDDDEELKKGVDNLQRLAQMSAITSDERAEHERALTQKIRQEEIARLTVEMSGLDEGSKAYKAALDQRRKLTEQFQGEIRKIDDEQRKASQASTQQWLSPMVGSFRTAVNDMILHAKSFGDAMKSLGMSLADNFMQMCEQIAEKWLITQITNALVADTTQAASAVSQVSSLAAVAGAGAAASQAGIPIVGPALAAGAAVAMIATVLGFESLAHAEGGMLLDRDRLVFAHKDEQILPAHLSKGIQAMIAGGGSGGGGATLNYSPTINAPESKGLHELLRSESGAMISFLKQADRDGKLRPRI